MKKIPKYQPWYDPRRSYEENYAHGPFADFATDTQWKLNQPARSHFFGHPVDALFGIAAGPLLNSRYIAAAQRFGFSVCVYKTVRSRSFPCHPYPNVLPVSIDQPLTPELAAQGVCVQDEFSDPIAITNSFGVPSQPPEVWQPDMQRAVQQTRHGQLVIGSFQGTLSGGSEKEFIADCVTLASLVKETGAPVLELNTSCPNEGSAQLLCFDIDRMEKMCHAIKNTIGNTPLIIKTAYFADDSQLRLLAQRVLSIADGISIVNSFPMKVINAAGKQALPGNGRLVSGVCGAPLKTLGLESTRRLAILRSELDLSFRIIGVGGVCTSADVKEYLDSSADLVMSATGAMWNPYLAQEVYRDIFVKQAEHSAPKGTYV